MVQYDYKPKNMKIGLYYASVLWTVQISFFCRWLCVTLSGFDPFTITQISDAAPDIQNLIMHQIQISLISLYLSTTGLVIVHGVTGEDLLGL